MLIFARTAQLLLFVKVLNHDGRVVESVETLIAHAFFTAALAVANVTKAVSTVLVNSIGVGRALKSIEHLEARSKENCCKNGTSYTYYAYFRLVTGESRLKTDTFLCNPLVGLLSLLYVP